MNDIRKWGGIFYFVVLDRRPPPVITKLPWNVSYVYVVVVVAVVVFWCCCFFFSSRTSRNIKSCKIDLYLSWSDINSWYLKGVFINTLVGGWAIENFCRQTFLTPLPKPPELFEPPSTSVKTFLTPPPIARCIIPVSFLNTNLFVMHYRCTGNT